MSYLHADQFTSDVEDELSTARGKHPLPIHSRHEGLAVLQEEVAEVQADVYRNAPSIDLYLELVQVAAMAQRMAEDLRLMEAK